MSIIDLFAGPGGWSTGLNMIGRAETIGIEWDKSACDTARAAGHNRLQADIAELDPFTVGGPDVEGLIASPPCQGFSMAGKGKGREDSARLIAAVGDFVNGDPRPTLHATMTDDRSLLALEPLRWVLDLEPEWTTWEQVPAVLPLWEACAEVLRADGYDVWTGLVQAETLGVPQTRKRAILRARRGALDPLEATHSKYNTRNPKKLDGPKWVSMADAFDAAGIPLPGDVYRSTTMANSARRPIDCPAPTIAFGHDAGSAQWLYVNGNQAHSARRDLEKPAPTVHFGHRMNLVEWQMASAGATARYTAGQVPRDLTSPAATITGKGTAYWTPTEQAETHSAATSRRVTVQEAAVLQSFPADYPWRGTKTAQYRQVGDAVPPLMAAHILASVGAGQLESEAVA